MAFEITEKGGPWLLPARRITRSEEETAAFAREVAAKLQAGDVLCLSGELGAGKTAFTRGLVAGLRGDEGSALVKSPTYTILNIYEGTPPIHHFDFYRVENAGDITALGLDDYWAKGISIVEWPKSFCYSLPGRIINVTFEITGQNERTVEVGAPHDNQNVLSRA